MAFPSSFRPHQRGRSRQSSQRSSTSDSQYDDSIEAVPRHRRITERRRRKLERAAARVIASAQAAARATNIAPCADQTAVVSQEFPRAKGGSYVEIV